VRGAGASACTTGGDVNGKTDKRRPRLVSREQYEDNWDRTFGKPYERPDCCGQTMRTIPFDSEQYTDAAVCLVCGTTAAVPVRAAEFIRIEFTQDRSAE